MVDVAEGVSNSRNPVPRSSLQPDDALAGDPMGREDFVPIPGAEPESPKVAPMRSSIEQDDSAPKRDSESNPEPVRAACIGYSPPPMSPKSDSTLGGTPPLIGTKCHPSPRSRGCSRVVHEDGYCVMRG
ncbi:hypothetical protein MSAN_01826800 [Mycena sanguinolenta]|uniref:Uncharacterized protein n=1 Tax=Mycena sanguinolenta TaxID=230812 RepID=A0A8H6XT75_9AGAR|nr:hypothetical protein MSAN_01826800 [Mycena sanguinolenta]